jgi:hypothetical protein
VTVPAALTGAAASADGTRAVRAEDHTAVTEPEQHGFEWFLEAFEAANSALLNGDPGPWLAMTTEAEPTSIFGGFGGLGDSGLDVVGKRYVLAAGSFLPSGAEVDVEYLVKEVRDEIGYTVSIERADVLYAGQNAVQPQALRVTMLFRYETDGWKIVHRHADMMVDLQLPPR